MCVEHTAFFTLFWPKLSAKEQSNHVNMWCRLNTTVLTHISTSIHHTSKVQKSAKKLVKNSIHFPQRRFLAQHKRG